jgi:hypothetical protein
MKKIVSGSEKIALHVLQRLQLTLKICHALKDKKIMFVTYLLDTLASLLNVYHKNLFNRPLRKYFSYTFVLKQ